MRTVVFVLETLGVGGTETSVLQIAAGLREFRPLVVYLSPPDTLADRYRDESIETVGLGLRDTYRFGQGALRLLELLRARRPALIHTATFAANIVGRTAGRIAGIPVVSSVVGDSYADVYRQGLSSRALAKHQVVKALDAVSARWVTKFAANSAVLRDATQDHLGVAAQRIDVIYRGRDPSRFVLEPEPQLKTSLGLTGPVVLTVGRLKKIKAHEDLIRAVAALKTEVSGVTAVLVGDGAHRSALETLARELDAPVKFLGLRHDIPELLSIADVFVSASTTEGHPGAVIEAMMAARPILLSDIAVHTETAADTAHYFPVGDSEALQSALLSLLHDPKKRTELGTAAQARAQELFSLQTMIERHEQLYLQTTKTRRL